MKRVTILGQDYEIGKMPAMKQMLILKRFASVIAPVQAAMTDLDEKAPEKSLAAIGGAIAALPDESLEFVTDACLDACSKKEAGGGYARIRENGVLMYPDLDLLTILSITAHALIYNFRDFFRALPSIAQIGGSLAQK